MCGIAGALGLPMERSTVNAMLETMKRRGPDDRGVYQNGGCTLLHTRLAIIDIEGGKQPMHLCWHGETMVLVYNGELYNTQEIRRELEGEGHTFSGHSDTEVVLHAYAQWGEDCVRRFNGIFAFAVWEEKQKRLFLARDRMGVKPLFFQEDGQTLLFASEIKTILACPGVRAELDMQGLAQLLMLGPGRLPGSGVFRNIQEVEPGWCGYYADHRLTLRQYWRLTDGEHPHTYSETAEYVRFLVTDAIRRQMVSDVPIGTFLSGGLDSSLITAICAGAMEERGDTLTTFSVDYTDNEKYFAPSKFQPNSDSYYIRLMCKWCRSRHFRTVLTPEELSEALEEATIARDLPGMADVDFSLLLFCRQIREHGKVALSGECADEIFGGYPWYRDPDIRDGDGFPWAQNTAQRAAIFQPWVRERTDLGEFVMDAWRDSCAHSDILPGTAPTERRIKEMVNLNFRWFMQTLLDRKDRMSMYSGLEVRVPFCDWRIAEYLYRVPWAFKDAQGREKGLLRQAMEGVLPEEILYRKKSPYPKTFHPRYTSVMQERLEALLNDPNAPLFAFVDPKALRQAVAGESAWPWYGQLMKTPQTMAYFLQMDFWLRHYRVSLCV